MNAIFYLKMPDTPYSSVPEQGSQTTPKPNFRWQGRYRFLVRSGATIAASAAILDMWGTGGVAPWWCLASNAVTIGYLKIVDYDKRVERTPTSQLTELQKYYLSGVDILKRGVEKLPPKRYKVNRKLFAFRSSQFSQALNLAYALCVYSTTPLGACLVLYAAGRIAQTQATIVYTNLPEAEKNDHTRHRMKRMLSNLSGTTGLLEGFAIAQYATDAAASFASGNIVAGIADLGFLVQCGYNSAADIYQFRGVDVKHYKDWHDDWHTKRQERKAAGTPRRLPPPAPK